jgi:thiol:disulfide interchange protein DsbD
MLLVAVSTQVLHADTPTFALQENAAAPGNYDIVPSEVIHFKARSATAFDQGYVLVAVSLETERNFALYEDKVTFSTPSGLILEKIKAPTTETIIDPLSGKQVSAYRRGEFLLLFSGLETFNEASFPLAVAFQGCAEGICLFPFEQTISVPTVPAGGKAPLELFDGEASLNENDQDNEEENYDNTTALAKLNREEAGSSTKENGPNLEARLAKLLSGESISLLLIFIIAFIGGLLTNLTPCVYPMIPITIRLLSRLGKNPLPAASCYGLGIVASYTGLGVFAAYTGSLFGAWMASPLVNGLLALIMVILGLTMLGYGNFASLQKLGSHFGEGSSKLRKALLMGVGAGLVAAPCTGPILAAMLSYIATQQISLLVSALLIFVYSLGFALPYVALGGASAKIGTIKVSAPLQNAVKLCFSALMFALACYYLRIPFYKYLALLNPYWGKLGGLFLTAGIISTLLVLPSTWRRYAKGTLILPSVLLGIGIFTTSQWMHHSAPNVAGGGIEWLDDEEEAFVLAKKESRPLLIDMWAEWCEACKHMDATTLSDPAIVDLLREEKWVLLRYDLTEDNERNNAIQERYQVAGLPTLIVVPADGDLSKKKMLPGYMSTSVLREKIEEWHN